VRGDPAPHREAAVQAWGAACDMMASGRYGLVVLDEIAVALAKGLLPVGEVVAALSARPAGLHVVATGRGASPELIAAADLVTEMVDVKHPFRDGVPAQPGIEW
jgi:cob(I)alamin adenosyltransferase